MSAKVYTFRSLHQRSEDFGRAADLVFGCVIDLSRLSYLPEVCAAMSDLADLHERMLGQYESMTLRGRT